MCGGWRVVNYVLDTYLKGGVHTLRKQAGIVATKRSLFMIATQNTISALSLHLKFLLTIIIVMINKFCLSYFPRESSQVMGIVFAPAPDRRVADKAGTYYDQVVAN